MARRCRTTTLSLLLLLTYRPLQSALTTCPTSNGYVHDVTSGLCVILLSDWVTRDAAARKCADAGDRLLWLDTELKDTFFRNFVRTVGDSYWLGGYRTGPSSWEWSDTDQLCHAGWSPGQPDGSGDCMAVAEWFDWLWDDTPCDQIQRPVCEKTTVTTVRGCGQLNTSTPIILSTSAPDDTVSSQTEETRTSQSSSSTTKAETTSSQSRTTFISGTSETTGDVTYMTTAPQPATVSVDSDLERRSIDIADSSSIALSSTTVKMPQTTDASSVTLAIWSSDEIVYTPTYTSAYSVESEGYSVESDSFMSSSYVIESRDSGTYICESSCSETDSSGHVTTSSSSTIDSSVYVMSSIEATIDSGVYVTASSEATIDSSVHVMSSSEATIDSSFHVMSSSEATIDSSVHVMSSSEATIDSSVYVMSSSGSTVDSSGHITASSGSAMDSSIQITSSRGYAVSTSTGSVLESSSDNAFPITDDTRKTSVAPSTSVISDSPYPLYTISTLSSTARTTSTTPQTTTPCRCFCEPKHRYNVLRFKDVQRRREEVRESLLLDKRGLAKFEARFTSADDNRPSSFTIATMGISILVACGCFIIFFDVITLFRAKTKKNTQK